MKRVRLLGSAALLALSGLALAGCELSFEFVVNTTADAVDAAPGDGVCETTSPGRCSLRAAIQEANAVGGGVGIQLAADATYPLSIGGTGEDEGATGDLDTSGFIQVFGHGATIDAQRLDRVLDHHAGLLILLDVELSGGQMSEGAGIRNAAELHLLDTTVTGNRGLPMPSDGVGANVHHTAGTLNVVRSTISGLISLDAVSGGIVQDAGAVNIVDSYVVENLSYGHGYELNQLGGTAVIVNSSIRGGDAPFSVPFCTPEGCTTVDVQVTSSALNVEGEVTIIRSTVAQRVFDGTQLMFGDGHVTASGSMLYGPCAPDVTSLGYNALRSGLTCTDTPHASDVVLVAAPHETLGVPDAGEPILDAIPASTPILCDVPNDHDRRQLPRPQGAGCDIGAIERQPSDP